MKFPLQDSCEGAAATEPRLGAGRRPLRHGTIGAALLPLVLALSTGAGAQDLASFAVLAGSTVTNTGPSVISGNVGVSPGGAIVGFPPGGVLPPFTIHANNAVAAMAQSQLTSLYIMLEGLGTTATLTGQDLGGRTLTPGVYFFENAAQLTGTLTLDAQGDPNALFVFNIGSALTTASSSAVELINGAQGGNVFFRVGSSATLGGATAFQGQIVALSSISLVTAASIDCGAALARNGAVTLDTNRIGICILDAGTFEDALEDLPTGGNQQAVADALDAFVAAGGVLPPGFALLAATLTPTQLAAALAQLSGEVGTGTAPASFQAMDSFLGLVLGGRNGHRMALAPRSADPLPGRGTVSALGYWPETPSAGSAFTGFDQGAGFSEAPRMWDVWLAGFGGYSLTEGDASLGTHDRTARDFGVAVGFDHVTPDTRFGFALGAGGTNFELSDGFGAGRSKMVQAAVHGRVEFDAAYVAGAFGYGYHDVRTERRLTLAGVDHLTAEFGAHNLAGHVEAGYTIGWLTPYAAVRAQALYLPAYAETNEAGTLSFALAHDARTATTARTELGARVAWTVPVGESAALGLHGRAAWAHHFNGSNTLDASFLVAPGLGLAVEGARRSPDSLLLSTGAELELDNGFTLGGTLDGEFAANARSYAGTVKLGYSW